MRHDSRRSGPSDHPRQPCRRGATLVRSGARYETERLLRWRRWTDLPLLVIAIGSFPLLILELAHSDLSDGDQTFLYVMNVLVLVAFAVDYFVELSLVRDRRSYARQEWASPSSWSRRGSVILPSLTSLGLLRILRAGRAGGRASICCYQFSRSVGALRQATDARSCGATPPPSRSAWLA